MRRFLSLFTMFILCGVLAFGQSRVVSGKVLDEKNAPIPGASLKVKGGRVGVSAGPDGSFSLNVGENATLLVSAAGYIGIEVAAKSNMTINLAADATKQVLTA